MKKIPLGLLTLFSIVFETTIISFPLTSLVLSTTLIFLSPNDAWWLFVWGLILDLFAQRLLGLSSLFFLSFYWLYLRYKKKLHGGRFIYRLMMIIAVVAIYSQLFYKYIDWKKHIAATALAAIIVFFVEKYLVVGNSTRKKLSL